MLSGSEAAGAGVMKTGISGPVSADIPTAAPRKYGRRRENRSPQPITLLSEEQSQSLASPGVWKEQNVEPF